MQSIFDRYRVILEFANQNLQHLYLGADLVLFVLCISMKELEETDFFAMVSLQISMLASNFSVSTSAFCFLSCLPKITLVFVFGSLNFR